MDSAASGDTLILGPGIYKGDGNRGVEVLKSLTITSETGPANTIIDCENASYGFRLGLWWADLGETYHVSGLTIRNSRGDHWLRDSAIIVLDRVGTIDNCVFDSHEYGIHFHDSYNYFTISNCRFVDISGWGIMAAFTLQLDIERCEFERVNMAICCGNAAVSVRSCSFHDGEVAVSSADYAAITIVNSSIVGCRNAFSFFYGNVTIANSLIADGEGVMLDFDASRIRMRQNVIMDHTGPLVAGVGELVLENNTICDNDAGRSALFWFEGDVSINANILAWNEFATIGEVSDALGPSVGIAGNNLFGNTSNEFGGVHGNFSADPWFCNRFEGDYSLQEGSPCLPENSPTGELVGALGQGCVPETRELHVVPRAVNVKAKETLTAMLSGEGVGEIDPATVRLNGVVAPQVFAEKLGPDAPATGGHGRDKATFHFNMNELAPTLTGERRQAITLTAQLADGSPLRVVEEMQFIGLPEGITTGAVVEMPEPGPAVVPGLHSVSPNPFNPTTHIRFGIARPGVVTLNVYDVAGRVVARLVDGTMPAGEYTVTWDAVGACSGVYFARLVTPEGRWTKKLVVIK